MMKERADFRALLCRFMAECALLAWPMTFGYATHRKTPCLSSDIVPIPVT